MDTALTATNCFSFGSWRWLRHERILLGSGGPVLLGSRAREILALLLEEPGVLVTNERLMSRVWPGTFVVEVALRVHIAHLRRILRDGVTCYVQNVRGVGYQFIAPSTSATVLSDRSREADVTGRSSIIVTVRDLVVQRRLVTLTGPAGVGKSAVALAAASGLTGHFGIAVKVVDMLETTSAAAFGQAVSAAVAVLRAGSVSNTGANVGRGECLLVVDHCDRLVAAAARCIERALEAAPGLRILAICRRPLGARHEHVLRLQPLELPKRTPVSAAEAVQFSAVDLFVRRARASADDFELTDANATTVAGICARLDGLPLAIELAAARIHELGLAGLAVPVELLIDILTCGQRTSPPHHRSLRGLLDLSYESLPERERVALCCVAVFPTAFTLEQAAAVIPEDVLDWKGLRDGLASLQAASFIEEYADGGTLRYRLSNIQRAYGFTQLRGMPEYGRVVSRQHVAGTAGIVGATLTLVARG